MNELETQIAQSDGGESEPQVYPHPIAFNCIPQVDQLGEDGYSGEEHKIINETRKILGNQRLPISATAVRVPVRVGHSEAVNLTLSRPLSVAEARDCLAKAPGVRLVDDPGRSQYPTPLAAAGEDDVMVGRIRRDPSQPAGLDLWISCDNVRKGAALNAIQIAELLPLSAPRGGSVSRT